MARSCHWSLGLHRAKKKSVLTKATFTAAASAPQVSLRTKCLFHQRQWTLSQVSDDIGARAGDCSYTRRPKEESWHRSAKGWEMYATISVIRLMAWRWFSQSWSCRRLNGKVIEAGSLRSEKKHSGHRAVGCGEESSDASPCGCSHHSHAKRRRGR